MFHHRFDELLPTKTALNWFLLCFNGGCINAGGFLATGRFVSHVTGFATLFGVDVMNGQIEHAIGILSVPLFFLLGAFLAGLLIERPMQLGKKPHFDWVMALCSLCLLLSATGATFLPLGGFGEEGVHLRQTYALMGLLCLASGLQNGAITSSSSRSVRTTHLTGLTTDLGLGIARMLTPGHDAKWSEKEFRANWLRAGSIFSFVVGSAAGAGVFLAFGYAGFVFPALLAAYAARQGRKEKK